MATGRLLYSLAEAADILSVSKSQLYKLMNSGQLESVHVGQKARRIPADALMTYVEGLRTRKTGTGGDTTDDTAD